MQQKAALGVIGLDLRLEAAGIAAAVALGGAQRKPGAAHEIFGARTMIGGARSANTGGDLPHSVHENRSQQRGAQRINQQIFHARIVARHDHGEFVFFESAQDCVRRQAGFEMLRDAAKERVPAGAPERIIDLAKAVEIDQRQHDDAVATARQDLAEPFKQHPLVGQSGQGILGRELVHIFGAAIERAQYVPRRVHRG